MPIVIFYSTEGCHLCDSAKALINQATDQPISEVDIADDDTLLQRYGWRIPVLHRQDNQQELDWPFTDQQLEEFLN